MSNSDDSEMDSASESETRNNCEFLLENESVSIQGEGFQIGFSN